jgi:hypothetical protein
LKIGHGVNYWRLGFNKINIHFSIILTIIYPLAIGDQFGEKFSPPTKIGIDHHENTENLLLPQTKDVENYEEDWLVSTTKEVDDDLCDENQENL